MEIADEVAHRALTYVAAIRDADYRLSKEEFERYASAPSRGVTRSPEGLLALEHAQKGLMSSLVGRVTEDRESVLDWLARLRWLQTTGTGVGITALGRTVLRVLDERAIAPEAAVVVLSDDQTPLAYAQVVGRISQAGEAMLVDPYFGLESILAILNWTEVSRILIGTRASLAELATAFDSFPDEQRPELHVSDRIHDRYVIPKSGSVEMLGTSLSGVGKKFTAMTRVHPPGSDAIRAAYESIWSEATPLEEAAKPKGGAND